MTRIYRELKNWPLKESTTHWINWQMNGADNSQKKTNGQ
jgi:hypothetical protein